MLEKSGSSRYSNTRIIQVDKLITKLKIYPNPTKNDATLSFNSPTDQSAILLIRSMTGEVMIKKTIILASGENRMPIQMTSTVNGLYIVELITTGKTFINKLSVTH
ncbi:MAG TPA: T9SS type A sorting domain-containing protein, partial [Chitinophagaceae bacterium]|nr:T9SS type A sorting domain-containing protein [Chitinophagaceae bacterium]